MLSIVITILLGSLTGVIFSYQRGFPNQIKRLEDIEPVLMTRIYDDKNVQVKEFAIEKRTLVRSSDLPDILKKALITSEDKEFHSHFGINFKGILRAILGVIFNKDLGGGGSITMQLARGLFLTPEVSFSRKFNEILLAIQIERKYSKDQILTFYLNQFFFGKNLYGAQAASKYYFGKNVQEISVAEAALLIAILPNPNRLYNIYKEPVNCLKRRNRLLDKMYDLGYITLEQHHEALDVEIPEKPFEENNESIGDYFFEEIRKSIEQKYGDNVLYRGGLRVYTSLNSEMQKWAEKSLKEGLREVDKRIGWRRGQKYFNLKANKLNVKDHQLESWKNLELAEDQIVEGVVLRVNNRRVDARILNYSGTMNASKNAKWVKYNLRSIIKVGDVMLFRILKINEKQKKLELALEQEPVVQGGIVAIDNRTGAVKAMVGGYSFEKSKWNRVTQALRQPGSTFKPMIYAASLANGYTASTIIEDEPFSYYDKWLDEVYEPRNHTRDYWGPLTLRRAFEQSRNVVTARIVEFLSPQKVVEYARRFGITSELNPYMSIALGTCEARLIEMVSAYSVFPNLGIRVQPFLIKSVRDQNNNIIEENYPNRTQVIDEDIAYLVNYLMQGVVKHGTGFRARDLKASIGGKTGTTDECSDAWFIGFSPSITVGVWVGYDIKKSMGRNETGSKAASPIFVSFMEKYLEKYPESQQFRKPPEIIMVKIDKFTGKLYTPDCLYPYWEAFKTGTEPVSFCTEEDHLKITDYYGSDEQRKYQDEPEEGEEEENPALQPDIIQ